MVINSKILVFSRGEERFNILGAGIVKSWKSETPATSTGTLCQPPTAQASPLSLRSGPLYCPYSASAVIILS
jgi:hypothetical protein